MTPEIMHELMAGLAMLAFIIGGVVFFIKYMDMDK